MPIAVRSLALFVLAVAFGCSGAPKPPQPAVAAAAPELACEANDGAACLAEGMRYENGFGRPRKRAMAALHYEAACEAGEPLGCYNLGVMHFEGVAGVPKDPERAHALYVKGCEANEPNSCANLAFLHSSGVVVAKDEGKAAELYEKACRAGSMVACSNLADMAQNGRAVPRDVERAADLFGRACAGGSSPACVRLGWLSAKAECKGDCPTPETEKQAAALTQKVCEAGGSAPVCATYGVHVQSGRYFKRDPKLATGVLDKACEDGSAWACERLGATLTASRKPDDVQRGLRSLLRACSANFAPACTTLGGYLLGDQNRQEEAFGLLKKACAGHDDTACNTLRLMCHTGTQLACSPP